MVSLEAEQNICMRELDDFENRLLAKYSSSAETTVQTSHGQQTMLPDFHLALERSAATSRDNGGSHGACGDSGVEHFESVKDMKFTSSILPNSSFQLNIDLDGDCDLTSRSSIRSSSTPVGLESDHCDESEVFSLSQDLQNIYSRGELFYVSTRAMRLFAM